jgi:hypothetical protein
VSYLEFSGNSLYHQLLNEIINFVKKTKNAQSKKAKGRKGGIGQSFKLFIYLETDP